MSSRYWPFRRSTAFAWSLILVPACIGIVLWLDRLDGRGGFEISGWILLGAIVVGLVPVLLVVLGGVRSVEAVGVKVAFAAVQDVVSSTTVDARSRLANNLGQPPGQVYDEKGDSIIALLSDAVGNDVVVVDLKEGKAWWETRLLLLAAGALRLGHPRAIVFTAAKPGRPQAFVGWAAPAGLLRRLLASDQQLRDAYDQAQRDAMLWRLSSRQAPTAQRLLPWASAGKATEYLQPGSKLPQLGQPSTNENFVEFPWPSPNAQGPLPPHQDDDFAAERFLLATFGPLETEDARRTVSEMRVRDLFGSVLHTDAVDRDDSEQQWIATIVGSTDDYFAVTSGGQFVNLVPREAAVNAVLLTLVSGRDSEQK